jgi:hypothetical protein
MNWNAPSGVSGTCATCGVGFIMSFKQEYKASIKKPIFCSTPCYQSRDTVMAELECEFCKKKFPREKRRLRLGMGTFCSRECYNKIREKKPLWDWKCGKCGEGTQVKYATYYNLVKGIQRKTFCYKCRERKHYGVAETTDTASH